MSEPQDIISYELSFVKRFYVFLFKRAANYVKKLSEKVLTNVKKTDIIVCVVEHVPLAQLDRATAF